MNLWMHHMRRGEFAAAWEHGDQILATRRGEPVAHLPRHLQPVWDGRPLDGQRVLVRCYHGLGDTVQFIRYAPLVKRIAAAVTVWAQPVLLPLLATAPGVDGFRPLHDGTPEMDYDVDVEIMELPHVFRSTLATLPSEVPYLHAAPPPPGAAAGKADRLAVGLVWQAGDWDERRSVPLAALAPRLAGIPGVSLHCLQRGPAAADWRAEYGPVAGSDDVMALAGTMRALDLIISVDSFPTHLAGALGRPVWTLLHAAPDWRWMEGRDDSPWYPTMRLFRQPTPGDWRSVIGQVRVELGKLALTRAPAPPATA